MTGGMQASRAAMCCLEANVARPYDHRSQSWLGMLTAGLIRPLLALVCGVWSSGPVVYTHSHSVSGIFFCCSLFPLCSQTTAHVVVDRWLLLRVVFVHNDALFTAKVRLSCTFRIWTTSSPCCLYFSSPICARLACRISFYIISYFPAHRRTFLPTQVSSANLFTVNPAEK